MPTIDYAPVLNAEGDTFVTLPPACYTGETALADERRRIFGSGWVGIGRADAWPNPGDYRAIDVADSPVIVVRDQQGVLRAYANVCRHRGSLMLEGCGSAKTISCPYHRWTYSLDGGLRRAPGMEDAPGFDTAANGLVPFHAAERFGFAFLSLDADPPDIDDWLADFGELLAPWSPGTLRTAIRREVSVACNWKLFIEVFNEYTHLEAVHPNSIGGYYRMPDRPDSVRGAFATQFGETEAPGTVLEGDAAPPLPPIPSLEGRNRNGSRYTWIFPNMTFGASADTVWVWDVWPDGPDRCRANLSLCFPPESMALDDFEDRLAGVDRRMRTAIDEDIIALERQQAGLASPHALPGQLSPTMEPCVGLFARWYAGKMSAAA